MNIESLLDKIKLFQELVINSGLNRDLKDYSQSIQQPQNRNLTFMKDLSNKLINLLTIIENSSLPDDLNILLKDTESFIELNTLSQINKLNLDSEVDSEAYYGVFMDILDILNKKIQENNKEIQEVKSIFQKYIDKDNLYHEENKALMSLIFKDKNTIQNMKEFSRALHIWNRALLYYHTLLKSDSPEQINIVEIQNGSIDVIFQIDLDVAVDLTKLITIGYKVYGAYLIYKSKTAKDIIKSYMGNKRLIETEKEREKLMLDNVKDSIIEKLKDQHKQKLKTDNKIDKTGFKNKIEEVCSIITDHIIKGNEIKLLTPPQKDDDNEEVEIIVEELRETTSKVREGLKKVDNNVKTHILQKYSYKGEDSTNSE